MDAQDVAALWAELLALEVKYSPGQPRDAHGRWTSGGAAVAGFTAGSAAPISAAEQAAQEAFLTGSIYPEGRLRLRPTDPHRPQIADRILTRLGDNPDFAAAATTVNARVARGAEKDLVRHDSYDPDAEDAWTPSKRAAMQLMDTWVRTSGDSSPLACAMQQAADREFGLGDAHVAGGMSAQGRAGARAYDAVQPGLRAFLRASYDDTQAFLAAKGVSSVNVYRGLHWTDAGAPRDLPYDGIAHTTTTRSQPMSSYSLDPAVADIFCTTALTGPMEHVTRFALTATRLPAARLIGVGQAGLGAPHVAEAVVLGGPADQTHTVSFRDGGPRPADAERLAPLVGTKAEATAVVGLDDTLDNADWWRALVAHENPEAKYSPAQPRDSHGRWTAGVVAGALNPFVQGAGRLASVAAAQAPLDTPPIGTSVAEINVRMRKRYPTTTFDFDHDCDVGNVNQVCGEVNRLAADYPMVMDRIRYIGTGKGNEAPMLLRGGYFDSPRHAQTDAVSDNNGMLALNPKLLANPHANEVLAAAEASGWYVKGATDLRATVAHEFGHHIEFALEWNEAPFPGPTYTPLSRAHPRESTADALYREVEINPATIADRLTLSGYAGLGGTGEQNREPFAEAFCALRHAPASFLAAHPYINTVGSFIEQTVHGQVPLDAS